MAKFVVIGGYIAAKLGGIEIEDAFIDRTYLNFTGIADLRHDGWSRICGKFDIDMARLPRIVASNAVIGRLAPETAIECGLKAGPPIVAGAGDKPAGALGAGLVTARAGGGRVGVVRRAQPLHRPLRARHERTGHWKTFPRPSRPVSSQRLSQRLGAHARLVCRHLRRGRERARRPRKGGGVYELLAESGERSRPGSEGLIALGLMGGRSYPSDPAIRGMWLGQSWFHRKEHFYRALLEGIAYEYATVLAIMRENYPEVSFEEIRVIGGGARSDLWNQIKADVDGGPLRAACPRRLRHARGHPPGRQRGGRFFEILRWMPRGSRDPISNTRLTRGGPRTTHGTWTSTEVSSTVSGSCSSPCRKYRPTERRQRHERTRENHRCPAEAPARQGADLRVVHRQERGQALPAPMTCWRPSMPWTSTG